uniref:Variant surface glycoprotein 1125.5416 n=1 Tax=Trypanosoma brucei TaxID=5691 RepID=A0A1J0RCJ0_9TRYP|nr:variant surface glycoprotein 1125.5416 [Trypanosoma brucei]
MPDDTQSKKTCGDAGTPSPGVNRAGSATETNAQQLLTKCDNYAKPILTAETIEKALAGFRHALKSHTSGKKDALVLGNVHNDGQCGGADSTACIDYTAVVQPKASSEDNDIKWYKHMVAAQALFKTLEAAKVATTATDQLLKDLKKTARRIYATLKVSEPAPIPLISQLPRIDPLEVKKKCEQFHNKSTECKEKGCKWNGTDETTDTCEVDEIKVTTETNTAAGAEGAAKEGGTATGCAGHFNDKDKCEKMNDGKEKPVCAWKKCGEGDKDKEELRCRNGSVLVNEKLALSVVVVFMSLVAYYNFKNSKKYC